MQSNCCMCLLTVMCLYMLYSCFLNWQITLQRTWAKMSLWHKTKLLYSILFQAFFLPSPADLNRMVGFLSSCSTCTLYLHCIFEIWVCTRFQILTFWVYAQLKEMDDVDMLTLVIQEMSKQFPTLMETLVHERDQLVSFCLLSFVI